MRIRITLLAGVFVLAVFGLVGAGSAMATAPTAFTCQGTLTAPEAIPGGTYTSLSMPAGSVCGIFAPVTVLSPVALGAGSALGIFGGSFTVMGPLTVGAGAAFGDVPPFVGAAPIVINGPVKVHDNGYFSIGVEAPGQPIISAVRGPVTANNASSVQIHNTLVAGPVTLEGGGGLNAIAEFFFPSGNNFSDLEDNHILGGVTMVGYGGIWAGVIRNTISGPFTFSNNVQAVPQDEWDIGSNIIYGPATCNANSPAPNVGQSPGGPSTVFGPTRGNQAATCTGA